MCNTCGYSICNCPTVVYSQNWFSSASCTPCSTTVVCKKTLPAKCTLYQGSNLANIGLTTNVNLELVLYTIDALFGTLAGQKVLADAAQTTKNTNILTVLNDINSRLNALEGSTHAPYTI